MAKKITFLSPGVEINEVDQSFIPAEVDAEGPIIIGRSRRGPANMPVKVRTLDDFVTIFGAPVPGGVGASDVWRNGNTVGTTYAPYAAQAWLASEESPVTFVRLAGEQHPTAVAEAALAGWKVGSNGITSAAATNATAYGLFMCDAGDAASASAETLAFNAAVTAITQLDTVELTVARSTTGNEKFKIIFTDTDTSGKNGTVEVTNGTGTPPEITLYMFGQTLAQVASLIDQAFTLALSEGYISGVVSHYPAATETVEITNLDSSQTLRFDCATSNKFTLNGAAIASGASQSINAAASDVLSGALAAILYATEGGLALQNTEVGGSEVFLAGTLVQSSGPSAGFKLVSYDADGVAATAIPFNFDRASRKYIRNVLNTNPQATNSANTATDNLKTYWLGETFKDHLDNYVNVAKSSAGDVYAILLPLGSGTTAATNYGYQRKSATAAQSGWVLGEKPDSQNLFRFKSLHVGEEIQNNYLISIEDISEPVNEAVYNYATFTVAFRTVNGNVVEKFTGCTLDRNSTTFVAQKIGDQYQVWDEDNKKFDLNGEYVNQSDLFYVEMAEGFEAEGTVPVGFRGPVRPKGFAIVAGETEAQAFDLTGDFTGSVAQNSGDSNLYKGNANGTDFGDLGSEGVVKFVFPRLRLRENGTDGGAPNQARSFWGVRPKISDSSNLHDADFSDYVRGLPKGLDADSWTPDTDYEYSFTFTLEDLVKTGNNWAWTEGSYDDDTSYVSDAVGNELGDLFGLGARQFMMPVWGGFDGFDITYMEPMANELIGSTLDPEGNYVDYTISKALDSVSDPELVVANLLVAPGFNKASVTDKMISIAQSRTDLLAIIDLDGDYTPRFEGTVASLGDVTTTISNIKQRNLNSSYACAFYPWVQIADNLNGSRPVWIPSSVAALGAFARSQAQTDVWFAPAGFNRGGLGNLGGSRGPRVIQARDRLDSRQRDLLYEVNINPIATFPSEGVVIFGQKTLQADSSALDRINVRRLLIYLKSRVNTISKNLLFDPNLEVTWSRFRAQTEGVMSDVRARFGLSDYRIVLDETTTTADLIDRNIMYAKIFVKPARAIEYIVVDFVITKTGADFV